MSRPLHPHVLHDRKWSEIAVNAGTCTDCSVFWAPGHHILHREPVRWTQQKRIWTFLASTSVRAADSMWKVDLTTVCVHIHIHAHSFPLPAFSFYSCFSFSSLLSVLLLVIFFFAFHEHRSQLSQHLTVDLSFQATNEAGFARECDRQEAAGWLHVAAWRVCGTCITFHLLLLPLRPSIGGVHYTLKMTLAYATEVFYSPATWAAAFCLRGFNIVYAVFLCDHTIGCEAYFFYDRLI